MSGSANTHAVLAPSAASRWTTCTASVRAIEFIEHLIPEDDSSDYADEGTQAHDYAEEILNGEKTLEDIPEEFRQPLSVYIDECNRLSEENTGFEPFIEEKTPLFYSPEDTGTVDYAVVSEKFVAIRDLKYGAGVFVEVEGNKQLAIYAGSLMYDLKQDGLYDFAPDTVVDIGIVQPRHHAGSPVRNWVLTLADLSDFLNAEVRKAVDKIEAGDVEFQPSESACQWCPKRKYGGCKAQQAEALKGFPGDDGVDFLKSLPVLDGRGEMAKHKKKEPSERLEVMTEEYELDGGEPMTEEDMVEIFRRIKPIKQLLDDITAYLSEKATGGVPVEGTKLVLGREGNRTWTDEEAAEKLMAGQKISKADRTVTKVITLTQAEKLLADKLKESGRLRGRFDALTYRSPAQPVVALEEDKREAIGSGVDSLPDMEDNQPEDIK